MKGFEIREEIQQKYKLKKVLMGASIKEDLCQDLKSDKKFNRSIKEKRY